MKQPRLGLATLILVIVISLGIISLFEEATFSTWVAYLFMCCVPAQIVFALVWNCSMPATVGKMAQPVKGLALTIFCAVAAIILQKVYLFLGPVVSGPLAAGPGGNYQEELWLSSALLGLTFPVLIVITEYFEFWPMKSSADEHK